MNDTQVHQSGELARIGTWFGQAVWPDPKPGDDGSDRLLTLRRAVGALTVVGTLVQVVIWMLVAVFSGSLDTPWWLFTLAGGATAVLALLLVDAHVNDERRGDGR